MRRALALTGGLTVLVGVVHLGVATVQYAVLSLDALWFTGSGVAVVLIGVLSLLAAADAVARPVRWAAVGANLFGLGLGVGFLHLRWTAPHGLALIMLFLVGGILALMRQRTALHARPDRL